MIPIFLALAGLAALVVAALLLRRTGSAYRVGRLLATAPDVPLSELLAANPEAPTPRFVRTHGRISSDEEFPDEANRPLVYRRRRLERRDGNGIWHVLDEQRLAVPFGIEERGAFLAVDVEALGDKPRSSFRGSRGARPATCRRTSPPTCRTCWTQRLRYGCESISCPRSSTRPSLVSSPNCLTARSTSPLA